jgi:pimeloyl-ACP methyl ester carboxylesterase
MRRFILLVTLLGAAVAVVTPRVFRRAFEPPVRPNEVTPSDHGLDGSDLWMNGPNGKRLHAWWIPAAGPAPAVIVLHGWGGNSSDMLPVGPGLHTAGFHTLFLDARKHGRSDDEDFMSMPRFAEDLEVAVAELHRRDDVTAVGVIGHSVGAAAAIYAAARDSSIDAVVSVAPFAHPGEMMQENFPFPRPVTWAILKVVERMIGHRYDEIAPRNRIGDVSCPVMLIHGERDEVIPAKDSADLHRRLPGSELILVPNGTHADLEAFEPYFPTVDAFLRTHLTAAELQRR